eukprot:Pgem_evm1s17363
MSIGENIGESLILGKGNADEHLEKLICERYKQSFTKNEEYTCFTSVTTAKT